MTKGVVRRVPELAIACVANQQLDAYKSSSAASDAGVEPFGLRVIRAMQPSAARGETAECAAEQLYAGNRLRRALFAQRDRAVRRQ